MLNQLAELVSDRVNWWFFALGAVPTALCLYISQSLTVATAINSLAATGADQIEARITAEVRNLSALTTGSVSVMFTRK